MPNSKQIEQALFSMLGENKQTPPMFSAIKVKGKKLYEYARPYIEKPLQYNISF